MKTTRLMYVALFLFSMSTIACFGKCGDDKKEETGKKQWSVDRTKKTKTDGTTTPSDTTKKEKAPANEPVKGKAFNKAFPDDGFQTHKRVFKTEKEGFAQADYTKGGVVIVKVSFSDVKSNPKDLSRYDAATDKVSGHPYLTRGKNSSMVLVNKRFQVKVSSKTMDEAARKAWLEAVKFGELPK